MQRFLPKKILARCTARARRVLFHAYTLSPGETKPTDLLYAVARERGSVGANMLLAYDLTTENPALPPPEEDLASTAKGNRLLSEALKQVLKKSVRLAADYGSRHLGTEHFLAALLEEESTRKALIRKGSAEGFDNLREQLTSLLTHTAQLPTLSALVEPHEHERRARIEAREESLPSSEEKERSSGQTRKSAFPTTPKRNKQRSEPRALDYFTEDLTRMAERGELDPLVGRDREVERVINILSRRSKNNPILIGQAGVGKTAIVHGLAQQIRNQAVPEHLRGRRVLALDLGLLIAGTVFRGEFEGRLKDVIQEAEEGQDILFIDEVHTVVGAGSAQGSLDAANILKPAIVRGSFQIIGATTTEEYRKSIEKDSAFERRFQPVLINEPTAAETLKILKGLKKEFEKYHGLSISEEALERIIWLAERYLPGRFFPDKAIDVLDEAAASFRSKGVSGRPARRLVLQNELQQTQQQKELALKAEQYEEALRFNNKEKRLSRWLRSASKGSKSGSKESGFILSPIHIERTVSQMTGIALEKISRSEKYKLLNLEKRLKKHIVGQNPAVAAVAAALRRARSGIKDTIRPIGSFLFIGPSGVGKSELAKVLAQTFFEDPNAFFRLDMSEFAEPHTVSKLLGAPAGYVGYEDSGAFIEFVRRRPYSLILFDEVEKAHPHVQSVLLQILENGELTDARGVKSIFRHTLIILTANAAEAMNGENRGLGFAVGSGALEPGEPGEEVYRYLRPELVSRLDDVIVFETLKKSAIEKIVEIELTKLRDRLTGRGFCLSYTRTAIRHLADRSESRRHGARKIRSQIQKLVEEPLAQKIIAGELKEKTGIALAANRTGLTWRVSKK